MKKDSRWEKMKKALKKKWQDLPDEELEASEGDRTKIVNILESRYGLNRQEAEKHFDELKF